MGLHTIISIIKFTKQFPQENHKKVENFSDRQQGNAHEKSHQSSAIRNEIDESKTL
jgi:hypothetical protein